MHSGESFVITIIFDSNINNMCMICKQAHIALGHHVGLAMTVMSESLPGIA